MPSANVPAVAGLASRSSSGLNWNQLVKLKEEGTSSYKIYQPHLLHLPAVFQLAAIYSAAQGLKGLGTNVSMRNSLKCNKLNSDHPERPRLAHLRDFDTAEEVCSIVTLVGLV
jgi:hypothetical protein